MTPTLFGLIVSSVACSAIAQILLKLGMSQPSVRDSIAAADIYAAAMAIAVNPWVVGGLGLYFLGAIVWLFVLARVEVSYAYPFVGLAFIFTLILGKFVMGDAVTLWRILGVLLVAGGVTLIASH
jgi:drug/metabolite transporter (DMT)-like permease